MKLLARTENVLTWCKEIRTTKCLISFEVHWYRKRSKNSYPGRLLKTDRVSALKGASLSSLCSNGNSDVTREFETRSARCDALKSEPSFAWRSSESRLTQHVQISELICILRSLALFPSDENKTHQKNRPTIRVQLPKLDQWKGFFVLL